MAKIFKQQHSFRRTLISLVLIFIVIGTSLIVLSQLISNKSKDISQMKTSLSRYENEDRSLEMLRKDYEVVQNDITKIDTSLPSKDNILPFINFIENVAKDTNNEIFLDFDAKEKKDEGSDSGINLQIELKGNLNTIINFFTELENSKYFYEINKIDISAVSEESKQYSATISLKLFTRD